MPKRKTATHPGRYGPEFVDQYRQPFDAILTSPKAQAELNDFDQELALCQLVGPLAFARMTGLRTITHNDCANIVDDFLAPTSNRQRRQKSNIATKKTGRPARSALGTTKSQCRAAGLRALFASRKSRR
jgi:hypothetical protein